MSLVKSPVILNDRQRVRWLRSQSPSDAVLNVFPDKYPVVAVITVQSGLATDVLYVEPDDFAVAKVGTGATAYVGSDRYPYTVVSVVSDKKLIVQADDYRRTDKNGMSELQTYTYVPNPNGPTEVVTLRKNGRWVVEGESQTGGKGFFIGEREAYQDPSF